MILGLIGQKQSGKDTIADYLVKHHDFIKISFAEPIKEICKILFDFNHEQLYGNDKEKYDTKFNIKPRDAMKFIGMELRENMCKLSSNISEDIWIVLLINKINKLKQQNANCKIVITDVRFPNEYNTLLTKYVDNIAMWKIIRNTIDNDDDHISESYINTFVANYVLYNNGTLDDLYKIIENVINHRCDFQNC